MVAPRLWFDPRTSWGLHSEPEPGLGGRRLPVPRGKALGGSSAINGTVYNQGSPHDYDQWRDAGLTGWDHASLLPYFRRIEQHWRGASHWHGADGAVAVTPLRHVSPLTPQVRAAARAMGWPLTDDFSGAQTEGVGLTDLNVDRRGRRVSAADAFLQPARGRASLQVETGAQVLRVVIEGTRAVGVEYLQHGQRHMVRAQREVLLSGGAVASPQLLLLSGIGPADELQALGLQPQLDSPQVGRNFHDQPGASVELRALQPHTLVRDLRVDRLAARGVQWLLGQGGPLAGPPIVATGLLRTTTGQRSPDLRLNLAATTMAARVWCPGWGTRPADTLLLSFAVAHPHSRGSITLASADPLAPPRIRYNLLTAEADITQLRSHYRLMLAFLQQPALADVAGPLTRPAQAPQGDEAIDAYLRSVAGTTAHPMGSCRMGADAASVVDGQCRVRGIEGLRVVDASVFPTQISGNPHAAAMMLGDRVADFILGLPPLSPALPEQPEQPEPPIGDLA